MTGRSPPSALVRQEVASPARGAAPFEISVDCKRRLLQMTIRGEWDDATAEAFAAAYRRAIDRLNAHGGVAYSLVDTSGYGELAPEIIDRITALAAHARPDPARRTAIVVGRLMNQAQSRDVLDLFNARKFRTVEVAREWLFGDEA